MTGEQHLEQGRSFTIQQVAGRTGLSVHTLRYYERIGLIDPVGRDDSSGHRRYDAVSLARIESLARLRAVGLGVEEMRVMMHSRSHSTETLDTKIALLVAQRGRVDQEITALRARRRFLDNRVAHWQAVLAGDQAEAARLDAEGDALSKDLE